MYINKKTGDKVSVEDMQKYADDSGVSIEEYAVDFGYTLEETAQDTSSADLLDPTTFQTDAAAGADVVSQPMTASQAGYVEPEDTESQPVDTFLDLLDPEPFLIDGREVTQQEFENYKKDTEKKEIYGTYLKEDGTTGYNEKPYSVQLQDYKSTFENILKAEGVFEFLKNYDIEYRQEFAASQLADKVPRYTRQQYNQSTNSYDSVPTEDAENQFAKNLPNNFDAFDDEKDFNIALNQGIQKTIAKNPLINYQIKISTKKAQQELKDYAFSLREKYDLNTPEGIKLAQEDYKNRWTELVIDPVANSTAYKNTIKDLQLVASKVAEKENLNFGRYKNIFLNTIDIIDEYDPTGFFSGIAKNIVEPIAGTGVQMMGSFNNAQVAAQQTATQSKYNEITRLKKDIESGKLKENTQVVYGGSFSQKTNTRVGGKKGTVKDKIKYLEDQIKLTQKSIAEDIQDNVDYSEMGSLFTQADFSDGVQFSDILKTVSASVPYMAVAAAGTVTGNPILAGAGFMSMFTMEYGDAYMGAIEQGLKNDGLEYNEKNILSALEQGKYASQAQSIATGAVSASLERVGATRVAKNTMNALGLQGTLKKSLASLYRGEVKQFVKSAARGVKQQGISGIGEAATELGQNVASQISTGTQLEGFSGIGKYIDTEANREAALGGGLAGFFMPFGASVYRQTVSELRNSARDVATKFDLNSKFGSNLKAVNKFFQEAENNLQRKLDNGEITKEDFQNESQNLNTIRNSGLKIPKNFSNVNKKKAFDLIVEKSNIEQDILNKDSELVKDETNRIKEINTELNKISIVEQKTNKALKAGKKVISNFVQTDVEGAEQILKEDEKNKLQKKFSKGQISEEKFQKDIQKLAEDKNLLDADADGFFKDDGSFVLIMDRISDKGVFNTTAHEILHKVLYNTIVSVDKEGNKQGAEVVKGLSDALKSELNKMDTSIIKDKNFQARLELYKSEPESTQAEEVLTLFADALAYGEISYSDSLGTKLKDVIRRVLQNLGIREVEFNTGKDVYNFIKDYNRGIKKGKLSSAIVKSSKEGVKVGENIERLKDDFDFEQDKKSKSVTDLQTELNNLDESDFDFDPDRFENAKDNLKFKIDAAKKKEAAKPKEKDKTKTKTDSKKNKKQLGDQLKEMVPLGTTQKKYQEQIAMKVINKLDGGMLNPLIKKIAAGYGIVADNVYGKSWDDFFQEVISVQFKKNIMRFNPESNDDLGGYIIGSQYGINNRIKEALEKFKKAGEGGFKEDISEAKNVTSRGELEAQEAEKSKYVPLSKSNIIPSFTIKTITEKLTSIVGKLKSKITDAAGKNNSSTPLVREMKNEIGKVVGDAGAIPKLVIARLGNLKDGSYESNLIKHKKAIIENMTTTFLMGKDNGKIVQGGIPIAIEKSVGGVQGPEVIVNIGGKEQKQKKFIPNFVPYPAWIGKEIDRETTLVRGATAGNDIVRRVSADKVSDDAFVGLFIDEKGKLIRGKREAIGKAIGEEIAFEIFSKEIQNENSEISKAFDTNQEALGEVLADNFVNVLLKDIDRGTVKFSASNAEILESANKITSAETNTQRSIAIANLKNIMPEDDFNRLTNLVIDPYIEFLNKIKEKGWKATEQQAVDNIVKIAKKIPGLVVQQTELQIHSSKPDLVFKYKGLEIAWEIKSGKTARLGKFILKGQGKNNKLNKNISEEYKEKILENDIQNDNVQNVYNELEKLLNDEKVTLTKTGNYRVDHDVFYANVAGFLEGTDTRNLILDTGIVKEYYAGKETPVNYISFSDLGDFMLSENPLNLDIAKFDGEVFIRQKFDQRWYNKDNPDKKTYVVLMRSATPTLTNDSAKKLESKSSIFVDKSFEKALKSTSQKFSKSDSVNLNEIGLESDSNHGSLLRIQFSKSARKKYENVLRNKRPELKDIPAQVDELFKWADGLKVADNKKSKYKKLALYYTANGYTIFPEDGYKIEEVIRLSEANKVDPYAYKNPDELINKFTKEEKTKKINPDTVKEFSNKRSLPEGVTIYDVNDSKAGQRAVRSVVDSNWGKEANPWCLIARSPKGEDYIANQQAYSIDEFNDIMATESALGNRVEIEDNYTEDNGTEVWELVVYGPSDGDGMSNAWEMWKNYNEGGYGYEIAFQNGKLLSFRDGGNKIFDDDGSEYYDTREVELNWWDRFDKPTDTLQINLGKKNGLTTRGEIYFNEAQPQGEVELVGYGEGDFMSRKDTYKLYDENKELIEAKVYKDSKLSLAVENNPTKMNDGGRAINSKKSKYIDGELISSVTTVKDLKTGKIVTTTTLSYEKLNENSSIETFTVVGKNGKSPTAPKVTEKNITLIERKKIDGAVNPYSINTVYYAEKITDGVSEVVIDRMFELNDIKESLKSNIKFSKSIGELNLVETGQQAINNARSLAYNNNVKRLDITEKDISELTTNKAKADWLINKIAEGYNDFYFIDNKMNEVKAVKNVLNTFDVKGKVQQAKVKFSKSMNTTFNEMLQRSTGIEAGETIERSIARRRGATKGKFKVWMPSSLDDFKGLTSYTFAGKGRQGEADQKFFQDALITPYFRGIRAIEQSRQAFIDDFKTLNKQMRPVLKKLGKIVPGTEFTHDQAIRIALWTASGYDIPGISESDIKTLVDFVNDNADLSEYTRKLQLISKRKKWAKPGDFWDAETILSDLNNLTEKVGRKEYLTEFIENVDIIFSEDNLNKVEAGYGEAQKEALKDIIYRMKNGTNRPSGSKKNENRFNNWVNNSIGAIMFFNRRSALLQTLSIANFINWGDNNVLKAGAAFANQPQYWKDFATLFNSSKLKQRRSGLKSDVNEAEIANAVKGSRNKAVSALSYLLKIGFTPTQLADSFAIASGGATFYRNRINSYLKEVNAEGEKVYTQKQAEEKAFEDFSQISEETQQSGDPALISSDQASTLGRMILAFQNTPIQLNRSIKKAALDIKNRRRTPGQTMLQSDFSNISKIIYYGTVQNIIFSALQNALFALIPGFEDEDDELTEEEQLEKYGKIYSTKQSRIVNGMVDTTLKGGFGVPGAFISTIKNAYLEYAKQKEKGFIGDQGYTILAAANLSPPVGSKLRKIYSAIKTEEFDKDVIAKRGWDITIDGKFNLSPAYKVLGSVTEGLTNLPLDRMVAEISSVTEALDARNSKWQRIALALGWKTWDVNVKNEEHELIKTEAKAKRKEEGKVKAKEKRTKNKKEKDDFYKRVGKTLTKEEKRTFFAYRNKTNRRAYLDKLAKQKGIK